MADAQTKVAWAREYIAKNHSDYVDAESAYRDLIRGLLNSDTVALDAGCGHGGPVQDYRDEIKLVAGADLDFESLKRNPNLCGLSVMADLNHLPYKDNTFDLITSQWVLEHLADPEATFSELSRLLKPQGYFVTITPNINNPVIRISNLLPVRIKALILRMLGRGKGDTFPTFYKANSPERLEELAKMTGLELVTLQTYGAPFYFIFSRWLFKLSVWMDKRELNKPTAEHKAHILAVFKKRNAGV